MLDAYQVLYMNNERFSVPEILFRPDDIGKSAYFVVDFESHRFSQGWSRRVSHRLLHTASLCYQKISVECFGPTSVSSEVQQSSPGLEHDCKIPRVLRSLSPNIVIVDYQSYALWLQ